MSVLVKVCGLTNELDISASLQQGADYIGVNLYQKSPRAVDLSRAVDLLGEIPPGKRVLVDVATPTHLLEEYKNLSFDYYQIHFDLDIAISSVAAWAGIVGRERLWLAPRIGPREQFFPQIVMEFADTIVLDTYSSDKYGGSGKTGDWQRFMDWSTLYQHKEWVLAGGLNPDNIEEAIRTTGAEIVDVASGVESSPGRKDHEKLARFFASVRQGELS